MSAIVVGCLGLMAGKPQVGAVVVELTQTTEDYLRSARGARERRMS